jgi:hypothetical protein
MRYANHYTRSFFAGRPGAALLLFGLLVAAAPEAAAATFTDLALENGWTQAPAARKPSVSLVSGIVQFDGAMVTNAANAVAFTLPIGFWPPTNVYVPVDLCNATKGRLFIQPSGVVTVQAENGTFANAQCRTSLDGASFALSSGGFTSLSLNGWTNAPFATRNAAAANIAGIIRLQGAIATSGASSVAFTLPIGLRPATTVYVAVDLCGATNGRLVIAPSGMVSVEAEGGAFANAQCFTSLEGVVFAASTTGFIGLPLENGWTGAPFGTAGPAVQDIGGILHFAGAMASGTDPTAFQLPTGFRPAADVDLPVDLCNATKGRLVVLSNGVGHIEAEGGAFGNAQCFTSLEGVSFALTNFRPLALQNGWTNAPFATTDAALAIVRGIVHLRGAIATGGSNPLAFTLPGGFRPAANVYVPVDLCNAAKGRLFIQSTGDVAVQTEGAFADAQCFTSLEGVSFAVLTNEFTGLTLANGWTNAPFGTRTAAVTNTDGIIRLQGAIANGVTPNPFTLALGFRPATTVFVPVDLCGATKGRLVITPSGVVTVEAEGGAFGNAQCFTSLDSVAFAAAGSAFTSVALQNGWTTAPFGTAAPAVKDLGGIVQLTGGIVTSATNPVAFTLPGGFRPTTDVYVPIDLCHTVKGRLWIQPSGVVTVQAEDTFADAQCFTSLDGASFAE